jgi:2-oxoglutarate dehydrogenase E2 component (dihydrolipoamide succinyltransferase)
MVTKILVPTFANAGVRLSVGRWFKRAGDPVSFDEPLAEIDTDNLTHEIREPVTGVLSQILVKADLSKLAPPSGPSASSDR